MPTVDIPFPKSSLPGQQPGEGQGRLLNCYCEVDAGVPTWRAVPGFTAFCDTTLATPRGMIVTGGLLYAAYEDDVVTVTENGAITSLTGTLSGAEPVSWGRNNASPTPDLIVVSENGAFNVTAAAVSSFADGDLPQPNSVTDLDGYIIFSTRSGQIWATDLNAVTVNALSFTQAQANPDGLYRVIRVGREVLAMGDNSIEFYENVGATPFPLQRTQVVPVGLIAPWAVAGYESGWDRALVFVAADGTVRRLDGYTPTVVSTKDVERAISSVVDKRTIKACVHVVGGQPVFSLSSNSWTWEFNLASGFWHERTSYGLNRWRGTMSANFAGSWMLGDTEGGKIQRLAEPDYDEDGGVIAMLLESGPIKQFPSRTAVSSAFFDFTTGQGNPLGPDDEVNPSVTVQWSMDGGATWSNGVNVRSLGGQGDFVNQIRVNRIGLSTHHGVRFRLSTSSPVYKTMRGGRAEAMARAAA
jgi:hypothetical protein